MSITCSHLTLIICVTKMANVKLNTKWMGLGKRDYRIEWRLYPMCSLNGPRAAASAPPLRDENFQAVTKTY